MPILVHIIYKNLNMKIAHTLRRARDATWRASALASAVNDHLSDGGAR